MSEAWQQKLHLSLPWESRLESFQYGTGMGSSVPDRCSRLERGPGSKLMFPTLGRANKRCLRHLYPRGSGCNVPQAY